ncbi:hypothetical protein I551_8780 [Mycobacterium ulcerans str. Harvey]|uniref:Uncharacterized protein n=1 Tax=Mycobacterium ulcerans str. Harvey TaxID=1299332 RepID=A0ABN0RA36_MYCUL|nr:hypothetical protein I551_8780 [Mycobacterium ulcerans str. Harvey]
MAMLSLLRSFSRPPGDTETWSPGDNSSRGADGLALGGNGQLVAQMRCRS